MKNTRDRCFVAAHRGGPLTKENHRGLMKWARECSEHVLPLIGEKIDERLIHTLNVAKEWENGNVKAGVAMKVLLGAHTVARESSDPVSTAVARSIRQAVITVHMTDHLMGTALYCLISVKLAGKSVEEERE